MSRLQAATANAEFSFQSCPFVHFHQSLSAPPAALEFLTAGLRSLFNHSRKSECQLEVDAVKSRSPTPKRVRSTIAVSQKAVQLHRKNLDMWAKTKFRPDAPPSQIVMSKRFSKSSSVAVEK